MSFDFLSEWCIVLFVEKFGLMLLFSLAFLVRKSAWFRIRRWVWSRIRERIWIFRRIHTDQIHFIGNFGIMRVRHDWFGTGCERCGRHDQTINLSRFETTIDFLWFWRFCKALYANELFWTFLSISVSVFVDLLFSNFVYILSLCAVAPSQRIHRRPTLSTRIWCVSKRIMSLTQRHRPVWVISLVWLWTCRLPTKCRLLGIYCYLGRYGFVCNAKQQCYRGGSGARRAWNLSKIVYVAYKIRLRHVTFRCWTPFITSVDAMFAILLLQLHETIT